MKAMKAMKPNGPISRFDAADSRLLKKEFLRLIRLRASILRTLCSTDEKAIGLLKLGDSPKGEDFEADIEKLIWKWTSIYLESEAMKEVKAAAEKSHKMKAGRRGAVHQKGDSK